MHAKSAKVKNLALFDFDGTLCNKDSFTGFIFYALKKRHIVKQGIKILPWIQAYYLNIYPADSMRPKLFKAMFANMCTIVMRKIAKEYSHQLKDNLNHDLFEQLLKHQQNGDDIAIVSASIDVYLQEIAQILDVNVICTKAEIKDDRFTGNFLTPDCSKEQKKLRVLQQYSLDNYNSIYAYGNSHEDLDMLSLADYTYMVGENDFLPSINPQKKLA